MSGSAEQTPVPLRGNEFPNLRGDILKADDIQDHFDRYGAFLVRNFFSARETESLCSITRLLFGVGDTALECAPAALLPDDISSGLGVTGYISWPRMKTLLSALSPTLLAELDGLCEKTRPVASACYGSRQVAVLEGFNLIRRHRKNPKAVERTTVPWHRDWTFASPAGYQESMNCWVPLVEVGSSAPSLDFVLGSHVYMAGQPDETYGITSISEPWFEAHLTAYEQSTPSCNPGDIVVFDHQVVHRTQSLNYQFQQDRFSMELRWAPVG